jgi:hypothetical protein
VNPAWKRLLGYTDEDLKQPNLFDVVRPEMPPKGRSC